MEGDFLFIGFTDGTLRVHRLRRPELDSDKSLNADDFFTLAVHGPENGFVNRIYSFETSTGPMIVTGSKDGGIVVHELVGLGDDHSQFKKRTYYRNLNLGRISWDEARASVLLKDDKVKYTLEAWIACTYRRFNLLGYFR